VNQQSKTANHHYAPHQLKTPRQRLRKSLALPTARRLPPATSTTAAKNHHHAPHASPTARRPPPPTPNTTDKNHPPNHPDQPPHHTASYFSLHQTPHPTRHIYHSIKNPRLLQYLDILFYPDCPICEKLQKCPKNPSQPTKSVQFHRCCCLLLGSFLYPCACGVLTGGFLVAASVNNSYESPGTTGHAHRQAPPPRHRRGHPPRLVTDDEPPTAAAQPHHATPTATPAPRKHPYPSTNPTLSQQSPSRRRSLNQPVHIWLIIKKILLLPYRDILFYPEYSICKKPQNHPKNPSQPTKSVQFPRCCCLQFRLFLFSPVLRSCEILYVPN